MIDLSGATVRMTIQDQSLRVSNEVTVEDSRVTRHRGQTYQVIAGYQGVEVEYWTDELVLNRFEGELDSITVNIPREVTPVEIPEGLNNLQFTRDTVFVYLKNGTTMRMHLDLGVVGSNSETGDRIVVPIVTDLAPGPNIITVPDADRIASILPDTIIVQGWTGLGKKFFPLGGVGDVASNQGFAGEVVIRSALKFRIGETNIITDSDSLEDPLDFPIQSVELTLNLVNSVPLAGGVELQFWNGDGDTAKIPVTVPRRPLENMRVVAAAETSYTVGLGQAEIEILGKPPVYTRQMLTFMSNENDTAWVYGNDSLAVQASATVHYIVNPKGDK